MDFIVEKAVAENLVLFNPLKLKLQQHEKRKKKDSIPEQTDTFVQTGIHAK